MGWTKLKGPKNEGAENHAGSIRRAGVKNIAISIVVAAATYYSLTLVAKQFGGSNGSDAYFFVLSLTTLASGLIGSLLGTVFLPVFVKLHSAADKKEAHNFASSILSWCVVMASLLAVPTSIWNSEFFLYVSRFDQSQIAQMHTILEYFTPIFICGVLVEFFRVMALSLGRYTSAAAVAMFTPVLLIGSIYTLGSLLHEESLVLSLLIAKIVALIVLVIVVVKGARVRLHFNLKNNQHTFKFIRNSTFYGSANVVTNAASFYFDYQASGLGQGVVTALAYAQRIFQLPGTILLAPIVEIARTKFAQLQAVSNCEKFNKYYEKILRFAIYFSIPVAAFYTVFSREIISALFQGGAFDSGNVDLTAQVLSIYAWAIPFTAVFMVNGRACESYGRLAWLSIFGTIGNLLIIVATKIMSEALGYSGIPAARVFVEVLYFFPFGFIGFRLLGGLVKWVKLFRLAIASVISVVVALLPFYMGLFKGYDGMPYPVIQLALMAVCFFCVYYILLSIVDMDFRGELIIKSQI